VDFPPPRHRRRRADHDAVRRARRLNAMSFSRAILLAAGQGSRLGELTRHRPKCLMPIRGEPLLVRTVRQLAERGFEELVVVVGHMRSVVVAALHESRDAVVRFVENPAYATDTNIGSLLRGLERYDDSALVIEADVAFDDDAMDALAEVAGQDESVWFTTGYFQPWQIGGVLRATPGGCVTELGYVNRYEPALADMKKLLGVLHAGSAEMPRFHALLRTAAAQTTAQYYMMPWVEHLAELPARERDLGGCRTAAFNTPDEYRRCCELFPSTPQPEETHVR
jgi:bifunctional N-acetylglucosamine-1-phosphate-uridyltransferase/glucosamine-1-phosphate-acetyltransferase GlmU-like protein